MKPYSIIRRLIVTVLLVELASALCVSGLAYLYERQIHFRAFDVLLRGRADSVLGAVQDAEDPGDNVMMDGSEMSLPADDIYEVKDADGRVVGRSANWSGSDSLPLERHGHERHRSADDARDDEASFAHASIHGRQYEVIRIGGLRIVDPGDKGGGIRRYVVVYYGSPVERVWRGVWRAVSFYAISSLLVLAITGIVMTWLLARGLAPLRQLAAAAGGVSVSSWAFVPPESARMTRELAPLVLAIESALAGLERSFAQQQRFVSDAAHELKTGVAVVKSSLQLLTMKPRTQAEYEAGLNRCLIDCIRMEELVGQMLTLASLEDQPLPASSTPVIDPAECLRAVVFQLETMAQSSRVSVTMDIQPTQEDESLLVRIDPEQCKLLCSNLLMNAIQHSPADAVVRIELRRRDRWTEIAITDRGDGIDPADLPHIFERFYRSDPSRSRITGGAGLGLAICKAIVDRGNGVIDICSNPMSGTTVTVRFPAMDDRNETSQ